MLHFKIKSYISNMAIKHFLLKWLDECSIPHSRVEWGAKCPIRCRCYSKSNVCLIRFPPFPVFHMRSYKTLPCARWGGKSVFHGSHFGSREIWKGREEKRKSIEGQSEWEGQATTPENTKVDELDQVRGEFPRLSIRTSLRYRDEVILSTTLN